MGPAISQILGCDTSTPELAGIAFDELARVTDDRHDELAPLIVEVQDVWTSGQARQAAVDTGVRLRRELEPAQPGFGGQVFTSNPGGHSDDWNPSNPARDNTAKIVTGKGGVQLCPQPADWRPWLSAH